MATIPRFLLPRRGPMWQQQHTFASRLSATARRPAATSTASSTSGCTGIIQGVRNASTRPPKAGGASTSTASPSPAGGSPGHVLEKPAKFNPPSHGARLPRRNANAPAAQHYGGDLSAAERAAQRTRQYPGMMAPPGTWAHWFWTSRAFHLGITMSTLAALAVFTLVENFRRTSPFVDMLPTWREAMQHPILAARTTMEVVRLTEHHRVTVIAERRQMRVDDVAKRTINGGWFGGDGKKNQGPVPPPRNEVDDASPVRGEAPVEEPAEAGPRKKFLGIF
ncbi:hypothetical protein SPBR_03986 [Sporothrix brasiliensis 5110]|uniref:Uncharacterized protein n=1 Tax=Sporothrix brasiliensis 5110 TaxID=1398154 RepID=A0A0C2J1N1_9PEZI|nr:uncharacterized protein SPBR_03986 [Sporothrix brasiliensis 5110]KIH95221.1 hypothetical protein SPBR_03986 [Sporothrix brasiliensis 5110]